jgi:ribosomal protein S18 acetylase RimI-like enzyme
MRIERKYGYFTAEPCGNGMYSVNTFIIYPEYRGKGYARKLAAKLPAKARLFAKPLVYKDNGPHLTIEQLKKFYESLGFITYDTYPKMGGYMMWRW